MNEKTKQLQQIIAQSMYAGSLLAEKNFGGEINHAGYRPVVESFEKLKEMVNAFTAQNDLEEIPVLEVFPLYNEIQTVLNHQS